MTDIIIIDDSEMHVSTMVELLKIKGISSQAVIDPSEAIESITSYTPKLVILDIMMPGIDGLSLLKQMKENPQTKAIPVVILSGKVFPPEKKKALALGAEKFLTKPIDSESLIREIKEFL